ncbi:hypothetical protein Tco_0925356 [Tanacetum coccineum]|uniref:Uncharacterized protein n=1 Tax=Tanacetum coccineum TaxID=301880 RepID=A0ABQ5D985_9ASTR
MKKMFDMTDLGELRYLLGLEIIQAKDKRLLTQRKYAEDTLNKFHMAGCKIAPTLMNTSEKLRIDDGTDLADAKIYKSLIGRLIYVTHSRPDVAFFIGVLSRFMHNPLKTHFGAAAKRVLRYLAGTRNHGIWFRKNKSFFLKGYCDSDWAGSVEDNHVTQVSSLIQDLMNQQVIICPLRESSCLGLGFILAMRTTQFGLACCETTKSDPPLAKNHESSSFLSRFFSFSESILALSESVLAMNHLNFNLPLAVMTNDPSVTILRVNWAGSVKIERVQQVGVFILGNVSVSWSSKNYNWWLLLSLEAEYVAATKSSCQAVFLRRILNDLKHKQTEATNIMCNNVSAVMLARNPVLHGWTKHMEIKHHYIREHIAKEEIRLDTCRSDEQVADLLTKALPQVKHEELEAQLRVSMFLALEWHLKKIHLTWAHLEKKRTRLWFYTKYLEEPRIQSVETASQQIHEDDLEAMDLKWQLSLLSMRAKRECRAPRNKEGQFRNQDNIRKQGNNEDTSSKAILAIDGVENYETLKKQCDDLIVKLNQTEFTTTTYKRGLATVEEQLIIYRKNEVLFSEEVAVLKREVACKDYEIIVLKSEFEKVKQEKEGIEFKIKKFDKASKDLDKLLESQITDKNKKGLGYNDVPPPHPLIYNQPKKLDLSYSGLDEFKDPEFKSYGSEDSKQESNIVCDKKSDASKENSNDYLVKEHVSEDTSSFVESSLNVDKETVFLVDKKKEFVKPKNHEKPVKKSVRYAEMYRSQSPRRNQRNWNNLKSQQLGQAITG